MSYKMFLIEWEMGVTWVKDLDLSNWLIENAVNNYNIKDIITKYK